LDGQFQFHWENYPIPLDDISPISQWNENKNENERLFPRWKKELIGESDSEKEDHNKMERKSEYSQGNSFSQQLPSFVPTFYKGYFNVTEVADTWIAITRTFTKVDTFLTIFIFSYWHTFFSTTHFFDLVVEGVVWINRFNLGRYWDIGPQQNLFLPGPLLKRGYFFHLHFQINKNQQKTTLQR
jgi:hypothetical protein